jgi:hypothetical protein
MDVKAAEHGERVNESVVLSSRSPMILALLLRRYRVVGTSNS